MEADMDAEWRNDLDLLLALASEYEASEHISYIWKSNAYPGLLDLLSWATRSLREAYNTGDSESFNQSFQTVCILLEEAVDALWEHPNTKEAQEFADANHVFFSWLDQKIKTFSGDLVDRKSFDAALKGVHATRARFAHQLN
ncbi:hypothetical protein H7X87_00160 [Acetobacteraceae bacterium]|nr:hypothetical protein [Candidatus Parcubacteria bacterium]